MEIPVLTGSPWSHAVLRTGCGRPWLSQEPDLGLLLCVAGISLEGRHWKAWEKSEDVFSELPGWEKSMFGAEMDEGANFGS